MQTALVYLYYIYDKFIDFIFNKMEFFTNVTFGWVLVVCFIFIIMFRNVLNLPVNGRIGSIHDDNGSRIGVKH